MVRPLFCPDQKMIDNVLYTFYAALFHWKLMRTEHSTAILFGLDLDKKNGIESCISASNWNSPESGRNFPLELKMLQLFDWFWLHHFNMSGNYTLFSKNKEIKLKRVFDDLEQENLILDEDTENLSVLFLSCIYIFNNSYCIHSVLILFCTHMFTHLT